MWSDLRDWRDGPLLGTHATGISGETIFEFRRRSALSVIRRSAYDVEDGAGQPAIWLAREKQIREELDDSAAGKRSRGPTTCGWSPMFGCWPMTTSAASRDFETLSVPRPSLAAEFNRVSFCMRTVATHRSGTGGGTRSGMQSVSQPAGGQGKELRRRVRTTAEAVGVAMPFLFGRYPSPPNWHGERKPSRGRHES